MTYIIGLTGGLGAGKTAAADFFKQVGVPIIDADVIAKSLVTQNSPALSKIVEHFGTQILLENGELNRSALREIIFENPLERKWLENLLHPEIRTRIKQQIKEVTYPYCIVVIPLLAENYAAYQDLLHHVIVVQTTPSLQKHRISIRDKSTDTLIDKMLQSQVTQEERLKIAHTILPNSGTLDELNAKVKLLHQGFLNSIP
ncbi:MAG: dephospho-CoA kinase [Candidatus Berkiella sp.]